MDEKELNQNKVQNPKPRRQKYFLAAAIVLVILSAGIIVFMLVSNGDELQTDLNDNPEQRSEESSLDEAEGPEDLDNKEIDLNKVIIKDQPFYFEVPNGWFAKTIRYSVSDKPYGNLSIISDGAEFRHFGAFGPNLVTGTSISVSSSERDVSLEKQFDVPEKAYVPNIGVPTVAGEQFDVPEKAYVPNIGVPTVAGEQFDAQGDNIDYSAFKTFKNYRGIEFFSYPFAYEGCSLVTVLIGQGEYYSIRINKDDGCPGIELLEDQNIVNFFESISFEDKSVSVSAGIIIDNTDPDLRTSIIELESGTIAVQPVFSNDIGATNIFTGSNPIPMYDSTGELEQIRFSPNFNVFKQQCGGGRCGFISSVYDEVLIYSKEELQVGALEMVYDKVYVESDSLPPADTVQGEAQAALYKYYITNDSGGYFTFTFTVEVADVADFDLPLNDSDVFTLPLSNLSYTEK